MTTLIVTAVGPDRPGLVADFSKIVGEASASLAESRMVNLRGHFALLARVEVEPARAAALREALLGARASLGLRVEVADGEAVQTQAAGRVPYRLKTSSMDQPGIVSRLTEVLRRHDCNVEELVTRVESAPFAGTPLFLLDATITLPKPTTLRQLRADLGVIGDELGCDIDLDPAHG